MVGSYFSRRVSVMDFWDPLPFPACGDDDFKQTLYGVGLFITHWEAIEFELSRLYSFFAGDPDGEAVKRYGKGRIFVERLDILNKAAASYFVSNTNQQTEAAYDDLANEASGFSVRRNEIAHGIVMDVARITIFQQKMPLLDPSKKHIVLIPPYYAMRFHGSDGFPLYAYNSTQLETLSSYLLRLEN